MKKDLSRHMNWMATKDRLNALKATFSMMHRISQNQRKQRRKRYTKLVYSFCPSVKKNSTEYFIEVSVQSRFQVLPFYAVTV